MMSRFEDFWKSAAGDGALSPVGVVHPECEVDALLDAWFRERQDSVECRLYLDEAEGLLRQVLEDVEVPLRIRRRIKLLLVAMRGLRETEGRTGPEDE